ncbi:MAG: hypothetical protein ACREIT_11475, partial [Tepidisphaeraceae bacterium]
DTVARHGAGFTLVELIFVVGIIAYLVAFLMPTVQSARMAAERIDCASRLRQIGYAIQSYANENRNWVPRDATLGHDDRPPWAMLIGRYLVPGRQLTLEQLPDVRILQCPSHPLNADRIPTGYVINAFAFETNPDWKPDGPIKITTISHPHELPWMFDAANHFPLRELTQPDKIFGIEFHDAYDPRHLPDQERHRISDDRHSRNRANVLYLDGHVVTIAKGELKLEMLDDNVTRGRATAMPETTAPSE